ncbi:MAG: DUF3737 family protein [Bacilli bacterium]|nr:DUF3737 family protein [Bacilli bacterium]
MEKFTQGLFVGERALYDTHDALIEDSTFADGESPLKESSDLVLKRCFFKWKYPLWYCTNVEVEDTTLLETARSGIWYTKNIKMINCHISAPKTFRRADGITLINCNLPNALETLWNCKNIKLQKVSAQGDYFGLDAENVEIDDFCLIGNYAFDGGKNITIRNAKLDSKDSFWNCENVNVYDSIIIGEYLGWNSKNITFVNCTIDSLQGMCYMKNIKMVNCKLLNTNLCFEFCEDVDAEINSSIDSVKNPYSGRIKAKKINELIMDEKYIDPSKTTIEVEEK